MEVVVEELSMEMQLAGTKTLVLIILGSAISSFSCMVKYGGSWYSLLKELNKASGVWSMQSQFSAKKQLTWPIKDSDV